MAPKYWVYYLRGVEPVMWCDHDHWEDADIAAKALNKTRLTKTYGKFRVMSVAHA